MRRLVGRRGTIAVNNACDLCDKRLLHAQPAPRNSMLRNRSASEHRRRTCVPGDIRCSVHRRCYVHLRLSLRVARLDTYRGASSFSLMPLNDTPITASDWYRRRKHSLRKASVQIENDIMTGHVQNCYWRCLFTRGR